MNKEKVLDLAKLARIKIGDEEAESLSHEFDVILKYVGEIKDAGFKIQDSRLNEEVGQVGFKNKTEFPLINIMREDLSPHESGIYTEKILEQAPVRDSVYIKVKKIL